MTETIFTVVLADDHPLVLRGLSDLIKGAGGFTIAATASDGADALEAILREKPDVAVLDVNMPRLTGIDVLRKLTRSDVPTKIVFLSATMTDSQVLDSVTAGVSGLVLKDSAPEYLVDCLRVVAAGGKWLPTNRVNEALVRETRRRREGYFLEQQLTTRELEIAKLVAEGLPNKTLARELKLSEATVKLHLHNIYQKLGVANRTELAARALRSAGTPKTRARRP